MNKELIDLLVNNPDLPILAWVDAELCGDDFGWWLGRFGKGEIREYAKVKPFGYYEKDMVFKDDYDDYLEYLVNSDEYVSLSDKEAEEKAMNIINSLDYVKAIFVYVNIP